MIDSWEIPGQRKSIHEEAMQRAPVNQMQFLLLTHVEGGGGTSKP